MVSASGRFSQFQDKAMENRSLDLRKMDGAVQDGNKIRKRHTLMPRSLFHTFSSSSFLHTK